MNQSESINDSQNISSPLDIKYLLSTNYSIHDSTTWDVLQNINCSYFYQDEDFAKGIFGADFPLFQKWFMYLHIFIYVFHVIGLLLSVSLISFFCYRIRKESRICYLYYMYSAFFISFFPLLIRANVLTDSEFKMRKYSQMIFQNYCVMQFIVSSYVLVLFALNCHYIAVAKVNFMKIITKKFLVIAGIFLIFWLFCFVSTCLADYLFYDQSYYCAPYFFFSLQFVFYPHAIYIAFFIAIIYLIPAAMIAAVVVPVIYHLFFRSSFFVARKETPLYLWKTDRRFLKVSFGMFAVYLGSNMPFIVQTLLLLSRGLEGYDVKTALYIELLQMISHLSYPYIWLHYEFEGEFCKNVRWIYEYTFKSALHPFYREYGRLPRVRRCRHGRPVLPQ